MRSVPLTDALYDYVVKVGVRETRVQRELRAATARLPMAGMQIGPDQAAFLQLLIRLMRARRCLEIGTFTGYSALSMALALPPGGRIVCCDVSEEWTAVARRHWRRARVENRITLHVAPALQTLARLKGPFDLAFIDADKPNYWKYHERCLRLVRRGGLIAVDNTLWSGAVIDPAQQSENTRALRAFNRRISKDKRVDIALLAIGDGLTLAVKR